MHRRLRDGDLLLHHRFIGGSKKILYSGALSASLAISSGIQPQFGAGELDGTED